MKNTISFLITVFLFSQVSWAGLDDCFKEAKEYGEILNEFKSEECGNLVSHAHSKIVATSINKSIRAQGVNNIIVIDKFDVKTNKITKRHVLAGDQTGLSQIKKIWLDEVNNVMLVLQKGNPYALLTFTLAYASNTAPLRHFKSPILNSVDEVRFLKSDSLLALVSTSQKNIRFINSDADSVRYRLGKFKPGLISEVAGDTTKLVGPLDLITSNDSSVLVVLDQGKILTFDFKKGKMTSPKKILPEASAKKGSRLVKEGSDVYLVSPTERKKIVI